MINADGSNLYSIVLFSLNFCLTSKAGTAGVMLRQYIQQLFELNRENEPRHEKTNVLVSDLVRHKPGCKATEDG